MSASFEFPLFRLPLVAFREVLLVSTYYDLIHFSTISKRCLHLVKTLKTPPLTFNIVVDKEHVRIFFQFGGIERLSWFLNDGGAEEEKQVEATISGLKFKSILKTESMNTYVDTDFQKHVEVAIDHLKELFKLTVDRICLHPDDIPNTRRHPLLPGKFTCKALTIAGNRSIDSGEIWNILESWKVKEQVALFVRIRNPKKSVRKWTSTWSLHICGTWLTFNMLMTLRIANLTVSECSLTPNECGRFVNLWYKSTNKAFQFLKLYWSEGLPDGLTFPNLNLEMPTFPYDEAERHRAYREVLSVTPYYDLIHFSTISKRCLHLVKTLKNAPLVLNILVEKEYVTIALIFGNIHGGSWQLNDGGTKEKLHLEMSISGLQFKSILQSGWMYTYVETDFQQHLKVAIDYLQELFKFTVNFVCLWPDNIPMTRRHPLLPGIFSCNTMKISGAKSIDSGEIWNMLESWTVKENVSLGVEIRKPKKSVKKWMRTRSFNITKSSQWLSFNMFLTLRFANVTLYDSSLTPNECGRFVNLWYKSTNKSFQYLKLYWSEGLPDGFNFANLNLEMPTMQYDEAERQQVYRYDPKYALNVSEGQDISRNGLLATIKISAFLFMFCVWHERFQNLDGVTVRNS